MYKSHDEYERDRLTLICLINAGLQFNREILLDVLQQSKWVGSLSTVESDDEWGNNLEIGDE